jgi:hypothetical protein
MKAVVEVALPFTFACSAGRSYKERNGKSLKGEQI